MARKRRQLHSKRKLAKRGLYIEFCRYSETFALSDLFGDSRTYVPLPGAVYTTCQTTTVPICLSSFIPVPSNPPSACRRVKQCWMAQSLLLRKMAITVY